MATIIHSFAHVLLLAALALLATAQLLPVAVAQANAQPPASAAPNEAPNDQAVHVAFCSTVQELQEAVNVRKMPHVVITEHLDMAGARPVSPGSLAVLSLSPATQYIRGICNTPPPTLDHPDALAEGSMFCVIEVLHSWLQVEPGSGPIETVISNLFVHSVRDGRDGRDPCMLDFQSAAEGSSVWLQGLALQGDASPVRGVCAPTCDISAAGCFFTGFSAQIGAAIFMEADRLQLETPSLSLESCTITGNTATSSPEHGAAIFTSGVPVMLNGTTVENNGAREIAVRGSEVYTIGGANQQKLIYDPSDQSLVDSIALLPEGSEGPTAFGPVSSDPPAGSGGLAPETVATPPASEPLTTADGGTLPFHTADDEVAQDIKQSGDRAVDAAVQGGTPDPRRSPDTATRDASVRQEDSAAVTTWLPPHQPLLLLLVVAVTSLFQA